MNSKRYKAELYVLPKSERLKASTYLSGLYTSTYDDVLILHFFCPLCGDTVNQSKHIATGTIDYEKEVAGEMVTKLRELLVDHFSQECGSDRERRQRTAEILIDKKMDNIHY